MRQGGGIRLALKVSGTAFRPDDKGVERKLDDDFCARLEIICADKEQVVRLFDTLRLFLEGVVGSARGA